MVRFLPSLYTLQENNNIDGQVIESRELVANWTYFSNSIAYPIRYITKWEVNIKTTVLLRTVIKSDIPVGKINSIKELPLCLKTMKQGELSLQDPFELS